MRKLISLGLLALLLSVLASPVFADLQDCEDERNNNNLSRGLYGLCVAYWTVENDNARYRILENFRRKAGDTPMPGTEPKKPEEVTCPCLDAISVVGVGIEDWGFTVGCIHYDDGTDQGLFLNRDLSNLTTWFTTTSDGVVHMCDITQSPDIQFMLSIDAYEYDECLTQLLMLCP